MQLSDALKSNIKNFVQMILRNGSLIRISVWTPKMTLTQRRYSRGGKISYSNCKHSLSINCPRPENSKLTEMLGYRRAHM